MANKTDKTNKTTRVLKGDEKRAMQERLAKKTSDLTARGFEFGKNWAINTAE
jgi:hypothetical protein